MPRNKGPRMFGEWMERKEGKNIRYVNTDTGEVISRRQFIKQTQGVSPEQKARTRRESGQAKAQKTRADRVRPLTEKEKQAKLPPVPKNLSPTVKQNSEKWSKEVLGHRYATIESLKAEGKLTEKQAKDLEYQAREEWRARTRLMELKDRMNNPDLTDSQRVALGKQYEKAKKEYDKARRQLDKKGILPEEGSDFYEVWYH